MKQVLLTGGGPRGFIGRNLKEKLSDCYELLTPSSAELNLCDYDAVARYMDTHQISQVIHSANHSLIHSGAENAMKYDLQMYYHLQKFAPMLDKILYFGSGAEYDKRKDVTMVREEQIGQSIPADYYGLYKYIINEDARKSKNIYNLRLFGIFGKYENWQVKFISNLCCKAIFGLPLTVRQNCKFDFLYVQDFPEMVKWAMESELNYHDYNICTGQAVELVSLAEIVRDVSGKDLDITVLNDGWNLEYTASNARLKEENPKVRYTKIEKAIAELYGYYESIKETIDIEILEKSR
jgi:GDP-L-fucose synthase